MFTREIICESSKYLTGSNDFTLTLPGADRNFKFISLIRERSREQASGKKAAILMVWQRIADPANARHRLKYKAAGLTYPP